MTVEDKRLIISPVYNEAETILPFLESLRKTYNDDLLLVNDGSTDTSSRIIQSVNDKNIISISHEKRQGYGAALISGFNFALNNGYTCVLTMDTDLQHNPESAPLFFEMLQKFDVVLGSRYMNPGDLSHVPTERYQINRRVAGIIEILFSVRFSDPFCGYRGFRKDFLEYAEFEFPGYGFALETLTEIIRTGASFVEIPVELIYFDNDRTFMDGLNDPCIRYQYYLDVLYHKRKRLYEEENVSRCVAAS